MDEQLNIAITRLEEFLSTYHDGSSIDEDMGLTVDDVRRVIAAAKIGGEMVPIRYGTLDDLMKLPD